MLLILCMPVFVFADTLLDVAIDGNTATINSCSSVLPFLVMGYKGYVNGTEVTTTGDFGGSQCFGGGKFFDNSLSSFVASFATSTPAHIQYNFYQNLDFSGDIYAHLDIYYDGTSFSTITTSTVTSTSTGNDSVLFLPGFEASRLYGSGGRLWEPEGDGDVSVLFMNSDGTSADSGIYTKDVLDEAYLSHVGPNIYKSFLQTLADMKTDGDIADYEAVPYDWRLPIDMILAQGKKTGSNISYLQATDTPYILQELGRLAATSQSGKVTIVAHSNGGLLAKALLKQLADSGNPLLTKVDKLILIAVPQLGSPSALTALLHGYDQAIPFDFPLLHLMSSVVAREFGQNLPGAYNFLPSASYFSSVSTPLVEFDASLPDWIGRYGTTTSSASALHTFLTDSYGRAEAASTTLSVPSYLRDSLLTSAESEHTVLDAWSPPATMQVTEIAGWGIPTTVSGIKYTKTKGTIYANPQFTIDGDGTVVTPSALYVNGNASTTRYWVDLKSYNEFFNRIQDGHILKVKHPGIVEIPELQTFITDIIEATSTDSLPQYISTTTPSSDTLRLVYSLHSPLTLDIYDNLGHHTGISTSTNQIEEQIPGTYFIQFGDVKYIFTPTGSTNHIVMSGYDTGTFTFTIDQVVGTSTVSTATFQDIPTTPTTHVTMTVGNDIDTLSNLNIDSDNNGTSDISLTPVLNSTVTYIVPEPASLSPSSGSSSGGGGNGMPILQTIATSTQATSTIQIATTTRATKLTLLVGSPTSPSVGATGVKNTRSVLRNPQGPTSGTTTPIRETAAVISSRPTFWTRAVHWFVSIFR